MFAFRLISSLLISLLAFPLISFAQDPQTRIDFGALDSVIRAELKETNTPGAAVGVVIGDRLVFAKGYGVANIETGEPVTPDTLFRIASVTKMFTATALATSAEQGKMKFDEPLSNYVKGLSPRISRLNLHQLLTHTAGLVNDFKRQGLHDESALAVSIRSWNDDAIFFTEPGKLYSYSNPGLALAGLTLQANGGKPYADMMSDLLFTPLGMSRTTFRPTMAMTYPLAVGHQSAGPNSKPKVVRPLTDDAELWPAGYMFSTINDMARFAIAFLNNGRLDGKQIFPPQTITRLTTPYVNAHSVGGKWQQGYGMRIGSVRGVSIVEHLGGTTGFGAQLRLVPKHRVAIIVVANRSLAQLEKTTEKVMELTVPLEAKSPDAPPVTLTLNQVEIDRYTGSYRNGDLRFELVPKDKRLFLRVGDDEIPVKKIGEDVLSIDSQDTDDSTALFKNMLMVPGADGRAEYLYFVGRALRRVPAK